MNGMGVRPAGRVHHYAGTVLRALANVSSVAVACVAWLGLSTLILDAAGVDPLGLRPAALVRLPPPPNELCALATQLGQGFDRRCDFTARLVPTAEPYRVTLDETWEGTTLVQRLAVRATSAATPAYVASTRSISNAGATRLSQVALVRARPEEDHLAYSLGNCGAIICGQHEIVIIGTQAGVLREIFRTRLGRAGGLEVGEGSFTTVEPFTPAGASVATSFTARRYAWDGRDYALREVSTRATAAPSPSGR